VDLDGKNSDSVYYDEKYMPDFQSHYRQKKERKKSIKPQQSRSQRKRVLQKKMKFIELTKEVKTSEKKSTLSREEMRMQRHLYIMQNNNTRSKPNSKKPKSKNGRKNVTINPKFNLGGRSPKEYLQKVYSMQVKRQERVHIQSQDEMCQEELTLSDREDIRVCCYKFLRPKETSRAKLRVERGKANERGFTYNQRQKEGRGKEDANEEQMGDSYLLEKRDFKGVFCEKQNGKEINGKLGPQKSLIGSGDNGVMNYTTNNVNKKFFSEDIFFLDLTHHFKKYSLLPSIN
jgi:hypothetical protein